MSEESRRILEMLAQGKISITEAEQLLNAIGVSAVGSGPAEGGDSATGDKAKPKYLCVVVKKAGNAGETGEDVNIRVPLALFRSGMKVAALIPGKAREVVNERLREKGIDLDLSKIKADDLEELIGALCNLSIDVDNDREKVRIFCQ